MVGEDDDYEKEEQAYEEDFYELEEDTQRTKWLVEFEEKLHDVLYGHSAAWERWKLKHERRTRPPKG